jgi:hypothetical protein
MFLGWYEDGLRGVEPAMPAPGFKWNQVPSLNRAIWEKHRSRSQEEVRADFDSGYRRIVRVVEALSTPQLLAPGHYSWTGKHPLTTYLGPNTASHYRFALGVIKRWQKGEVRAGSSATQSKRRLEAAGARTRVTAQRTPTRRGPSRPRRAR